MLLKAHGESLYMHPCPMLVLLNSMHVVAGDQRSCETSWPFLGGPSHPDQLASAGKLLRVGVGFLRRQLARTRCNP